MTNDPNSLQPTSAASEEPIEQDMNHLRQRAMGHLLPSTMLLAWIAFIDAVRAGQSHEIALMTSVFIIAGTIMAWLSRARAPHRASIWLVGSMLGAFSCFVLTYPTSGSRFAAPMVLILASTLFTTRSYVITAATLAVILALVQLVLPDAVSLGSLLEAEAVLLGSSILLLLSRTHLYTVLAWSGQSTERAMSLTKALRERQLRLNRSLKAMEEATFRIERMNRELALAQHEAETGRQAKSRFAATVSHEIRGPLNLVLGFSRLLALSPERYGRDLTGDYYTDVDAIYRNAEHLSTLVDDVLDMSRIEADQLALIKSSVDLEQDVVLESVANVRPLARGKGLTMRTELSGNLPRIVADPVRLRQALLNLLLNAVRLTESGGITVSTRTEQEEQVVSVRDTGPGIPADRVDDLFTEFSQIGSQTQEGKSTGLGLSITKSLVEAHEGRIWVESTSSRGTAITFALPVGQIKDEDTTLTTPRAMAYNLLDRRLCLVFHPDPPTINMLARFVEDYRVMGLSDPDQLLRTINELRPRAILTSTELLDQIEPVLAASPFDVPIISCDLPRSTGHYDLGHILGYLTKPIQESALAALIRRVEPRGEVLSILAVDDEPDATRLVESMAQKASPGCRVGKAYDGLSALDNMRKQPPDLVLIDWFMPRMTGSQTIERMRQESTLQEIPVIVVTGHDLMEGSANLGTPITVRSGKRIEIVPGGKAINALLDAVSPDYLTEPVARVPSLSERPD